MSTIAAFDFTPKPAFNSWDYQYKELLERILTQGYLTDERTGTGTLQVPTASLTVHLADGFPLLTSKKLHFKSIVGELLWFISGSTNKHELKNTYGVSIWDEWGDEKTGELGPVYGYQWRKWPAEIPLGPGVKADVTIDQLQQAIDQLVSNPFSRRIRVSAWNVGQLSQMALPACHTDFQFSVQPGRNGEPGTLHTSFNMRSVDVFLGLPFNMASYALLSRMVAHLTGLQPGTLTWTGNCVHLYINHTAFAQEQLTRDTYALPQLLIESRNGLQTIDDFRADDLRLEHYHAHSNWKNVPVAV
jgi:thymidylate synthase